MGSAVFVGPKASYASYGRSRARSTARSGTPTLRLAREHGAGVILTGDYGRTRWQVSDWSEGTSHVYGWPLITRKGTYPWSWGAGDSTKRGTYQRLPAEGLRLETAS